VDVELVQEAGSDVLLDRLRAPADPHVLGAGRGARLFECGLDPVGHEDERRPTLHLERVARVVHEHEHRVVERRVVAPQPRAFGSSSHDPSPLLNIRRPLISAPDRESRRVTN
jgi:hypothetical protein